MPETQTQTPEAPVPQIAGQRVESEPQAAGTKTWYCSRGNLTIVIRKEVGRDPFNRPILTEKVIEFSAMGATQFGVFTSSDPEINAELAARNKQDPAMILTPEQFNIAIKPAAMARDEAIGALKQANELVAKLRVEANALKLQLEAAGNRTSEPEPDQPSKTKK